MYHGSAAGFLDGFVQDEVKRRCIDEGDFGTSLANSENDVPLYDQFNRGLTLTEQGLERTNLALEGGQKRPGLTGYIPSAEEGLAGCFNEENDVPLYDMYNRYLAWCCFC
jgi:hypothetical protein